MKKLLLLGALLVVGATSFAVEEVLSNGGGGNSWGGNASLMLKAEGSIVDATKTPVLVVVPETSGTATNAIEFNFNNLTVNGNPQQVSAGFDARIEIDKVAQSVKKSAITAELSGGTGQGLANGNIKIELKDIQDAATKIGDLEYSLTFAPVGPVTSVGTLDEAANGYRGNIVALVTPTAAGSFVNTDGSVVVTVNGFEYTQAP